MPFKIEGSDVSLQQLNDLFKMLKDKNINFTLHIEIKD